MRYAWPWCPATLELTAQWGKAALGRPPELVGPNHDLVHLRPCTDWFISSLG